MVQNDLCDLQFKYMADLAQKNSIMQKQIEVLREQVIELVHQNKMSNLTIMHLTGQTEANQVSAIYFSLLQMNFNILILILALVFEPLQ